MAVTRGRRRPVHSMAENNTLSPQEEQVVRMRHGQSAATEDPLPLAAPEHSALAEHLLALEAQIIARAPQPRRGTRLRLV